MYVYPTIIIILHAVSKDSSRIKDRLNALGLDDIIDYTREDILERNSNGIGANKRYVYMLTPESFFTALQRAKRCKGQRVDPTIYAKYFQFLQKVVKNYSDYQTKMYEHKNRLLMIDNNTLTTNNKTLNKNIEELKASNARMEASNARLEADMQEVLNHGRNANIKLDRIQESVDELSNIVRMTLPMWVGSSVTKTMFDKFQLQYNSDIKSMQHMKIAFICGFYMETSMKVYFCCTNFSDVSDRIRKLSNRHSEDMYMLRPLAINLVSCDINIELATFRGSQFTNIRSEISNKFKSFDITLNDKANVKSAYKSIADQLISKRLQLYQTRRDNMLENDDLDINSNVLSYITSSDKAFFDNTRPYCQKYLNCYIARCFDDNDDFIEFTYERASKKTLAREEFNNTKLSNSIYALMHIKRFIDDDNGSAAFDDMISNGIITENDRPALDAIAKKCN